MNGLAATTRHDLAPAIVEVLRRLVPSPCALHEPEFAGNEWQYVKECLDTGWVSSAGRFVERFEKDIASYTGAAHAVAIVNGTAALHACLMLAGAGRDDEVIAPALTFVATANAIAYCGAVPHFADCEERTLGLDPCKLDGHLATLSERRTGGLYNRQTGRRIAAVVAMHTFGHPVDLDALSVVCRRHGLPLIEDAAESLGSLYKGRHTGNDGLISALSFNGNKIVTTGGGGAVVTNDPDLARRAKHLTTTAKLGHRWAFKHDEVGYNYRLPNLNAALGCAQLEQMDGFVARKRTLADRYRKAFQGLPGVRVFAEPEGCRSNYWLNVLLLDGGVAGLRDDVLAATNDAGFMTRPAWEPMHQLPMFSGCPRMDLSVTEDLCRRLINLPSSPRLAGGR